VINIIAWRGRLISSTCVAVALLSVTGLKSVTRPAAEKSALIAERPTESGLFSASVLPAWRKFPLGLGHVRPIPASECNGCSVPVSIVAVQGAKLINPDVPPQQTQLIGWINNLGAYPTRATERLPSFRPGTEAIYAQIADSDPITGKTRVRILEFGIGTDRSVRMVAVGTPWVCHRFTPDPARQSEADFKVCGPHVTNGSAPDQAGNQALSSDTRSDTIKKPVRPTNPPHWFACVYGCCTT
jgi:hypothetical protein